MTLATTCNTIDAFDLRAVLDALARAPYLPLLADLTVIGITVATVLAGMHLHARLCDRAPHHGDDLRAGLAIAALAFAVLTLLLTLHAPRPHPAAAQLTRCPCMPLRCRLVAASIPVGREAARRCRTVLLRDARGGPRPSQAECGRGDDA
ncbi:hypothetical protein AB0L06_28005 [Spirillospora sp. NPDC052269]